MRQAVKRRCTPPGERRVVSRRTRMRIVLLAAAGLLLLALYKLPYEKTYCAELVLSAPGERPLYGETVGVTVRVRVQRYFLAGALHVGTVQVEGDGYTAGDRDSASRRTLSGTFADADTFMLSALERHGDYLLERCSVSVERGRIAELTLYDRTGAFAGRYENAVHTQK